MNRMHSIRGTGLALALGFAPFLMVRAAEGQHVTFQNFTSAKAASNVLSVTVARPPGTVAGDLLVAAVATDGNTSTSLSAPAGWNLISVETQLAVTFGVWWKIAGSSEPTSYQFTWVIGEQAYAWIMRFTGHDPVNPINDVNTRGGTATVPVSPGVTTTVVDTLILRMGGFDNPSVNVGQTGLGGSHTTITMDHSSTTVGQAVSGGAGYRIQEAAGSSGSTNFSLTSTQAYRTVTLAIAPDRCTSNAECDDGNICTTDVCNNGFCENINNNASCDDGNPCTTGDTCSGGVCQSGSPVDCSGAGDQCNTASCDPAGTEGNCDTLTPVTDSTPCDDGDACNIGETCQSGVCTGGSAPDCSAEGDQCNTASCDPAGTEGNCNTLTPVTNGTPCDDGLFCTAIDECIGGACVGSGDPCPGQICVEASEECVDCLDDNDCDDGVSCTDDACVDGVCVFTPNDIHCDDGLFCNGAETCDPVLDCVPGEFPCNDGLECTENTCDEPTSSCIFITNDALCDDSNPCTIDTCNEGICEYTFDGLVTIDLQVQGLSNAVTRDVTFVVTHCTGGVDTRIVPVTFDGFGFAMVQLTGVDADATWISAREGHTLRRLAQLTFTDCAALVDFTGGDALPSGDFQAGAAAQDNIVDITDFSILASRWNTPIDPTLSTGADATGDGFQSTADFTAIQTNFLQVGDPIDGCALPFTHPDYDENTRSTLVKRWSKRTDAQGTDARAAATRRAIAPHEARAQSERADLFLRELRHTGVTRIPTAHLPIPNARAADINDDGVIDARDIRAFVELHNLPLSPQFDELLSRLERAERDTSRR